MDFNPGEVAEAETGCWRAHHERNYGELVRQTTIVYEKLYGLTNEVTREIVISRIAAVKQRDLARRKGLSKKINRLLGWRVITIIICILLVATSITVVVTPSPWIPPPPASASIAV